VPFLIDGDNLLGTWRGRERSDEERRALAGEIERTFRGRRAIVVFDGRPRDGGAFPGDVRSSGAGRAADDVILELLGREPDPRAWIVVTSDRSLGDRCRHLGARIERCDRFRARLAAAASPATEKPERVDDVDDWLAVFDETPSAASPSSPRRRPPAPDPDDER
jgi:hypothetical protein